SRSHLSFGYAGIEEIRGYPKPTATAVFCRTGLARQTSMQCPRCQRETSGASKRCTACGWTIPPGQHLLEQSGMLGDDAPAQKEHAGHANAEDLDTYRMATLGNRFVAFVLDTLFLFGIFIVVDAWAFMRWGSVEGAELRLTIAAVVVAGLLN